MMSNKASLGVIRILQQNTYSTHEDKICFFFYKIKFLYTLVDTPRYLLYENINLLMPKSD